MPVENVEATVSISIETSCRAGGVALGMGEELTEAIGFDASARHATYLISHLDSLLVRRGLRPADLDELYVSAGPGSFTGLRVGITAARTLGQMVRHLRCVAVPTALAVAENARALDWEHVGVIMDARAGQVYVSLFARRGDEIVAAATPGVVSTGELAARLPRPVLLIGEGLEYASIVGEGITTADRALGGLHFPSAEGVWRVGRRLARQGRFVDYPRLLPIYARKPEALRLWERRGGPQGRRNV